MTRHRFMVSKEILMLENQRIQKIKNLVDGITHALDQEDATCFI